MKKSSRDSSGTVNTDYARIRVDGRGGVYIPSEEIASLPEVKDMQQRAASIVGQYRGTVVQVRSAAGTLHRKGK